MTEKLLPLKCPLCGATPHEGLTKVQYCQLHGDPFQSHFFKCPTGHVYVQAGDRDRALAAWNTRSLAWIEELLTSERVVRKVAAGIDFPDNTVTTDFDVAKAALATILQAIKERG